MTTAELLDLKGRLDTRGEPVSPTLLDELERHESYIQLVWRRFKRSKASIVGALLVLGLTILAVFAEFFSPYPLDTIELQNTFVAPTRVRFIDAQGRFHWRPFVYAQELTIDPKTFEPKWTENTEKMYPIKFFVQGWEYKILGIIPSKLHLFGVEGEGRIHLMGTDKFGRDLFGKSCQAGRISLTMALFGTLISVAIGSVLGVASGYYGGRADELIQRFVEFVNCFPQLPLWMSLAAIVPRTWDSFRIFVIMSFIFALLSWTTLEREVRGKVMALRETDFILAAKEMGASDARIIFLHLYPNSLSHVVVILTLTIPSIILAEAFLSFLGIGIQEPLVSWGLLMRNAQNIQTLGQYPWMMSPVFFIIAAVLGFNFLGDGLRDAADPYATM
ncbi:MAG: ABC transporter permease [Anaerolineae bacterium]|nr:ABC transporter permease [Anaerolineae bacterium]MDW8099244.1 ABC transporter permease [Anaerolineae bacterium]